MKLLKECNDYKQYIHQEMQRIEEINTNKKNGARNRSHLFKKTCTYKNKHPQKGNILENNWDLKYNSENVYKDKDTLLDEKNKNNESENKIKENIYFTNPYTSTSEYVDSIVYVNDSESEIVLEKIPFRFKDKCNELSFKNKKVEEYESEQKNKKVKNKNVICEKIHDHNILSETIPNETVPSETVSTELPYEIKSNFSQNKKNIDEDLRKEESILSSRLVKNTKLIKNDEMNKKENTNIVHLKNLSSKHSRLSYMNEMHMPVEADKFSEKSSAFCSVISNFHGNFITPNIRK